MQSFPDKKKISKFNLFQSKFILNLILFFIQLQNILSVVEGTCYQVTTYNNLTCFNDKIEFHNKFRAGHFVTLKDGSLIFEYSSDGVNYQRFFYGLKKTEDIITKTNPLLGILPRKIPKMKIMEDMNQKMKLFI